MKKSCHLLFILIFFFALNNVNSQTARQYYTGIYVEDTIFSSSYSSIAFCHPLYDVNISLDPGLNHFVTGLKLYLCITNIVPPSGIPSIDVYTQYGQLHIGDTLLLSDSSGYEIYFPNYGAIYYNILAIGTPQITGEKYFCKLGMIYTLSNCANSNMLIPEDTLSYPLCKVKESSSIKNLDEDIQIYPTITSKKIHIKGLPNNKASTYSICNYQGSIVKSGYLTKSVINLDGMNNGFYLLVVESAGKLYKSKFVIAK